MSLLANMKIGKRLAVGYGIILLLMVVLIGIGLFNITEMKTQLDHLIKVNHNKIVNAKDATASITDLYMSSANLSILKDPSMRNQEKSKIDKMRDKYKASMDSLEKLEANEDGKKLINKAKEIIAGNRDINNQYLAYINEGKIADAASFYTVKVLPNSHKIQETLEEVVQYNEERIKIKTQEMEKTVAFSKILFISMGIIQIVLAVLIGLFMTRSITKPVNLGVGFAGKMADGDLTQHMEIDQKDEIGALAKALNEMSGRLRDMFKDISQGVHTLTASSTELSAISKQMSQGADQTSGKANMVSAAAEEMNSNMTSVAAAMEEASTNIRTVAAATEEMTATIGEISKNTEKARNITTAAVGQSMEINQKINDLGVAASEIGKITETITTISAQTNLLALNATIEAARAGAAGKGFAVVANEIKELAQQTATATDDIKKKIEGIQGSASGTITDMGKISQTIQEVNEIVTTIAAAIEEQTVVTKDIAGNVAQAAQGIEEVNGNLAQTSTVSTNIAQDISEVNQAAGEMSSSSAQVQISAEELSKVSEQIQAMVTKFKI